MYVHKNRPDNSIKAVIKRESGYPGVKCVPDLQRPGSLIEDPKELFSVQTLLKELSPFIINNDLKGALLLIRSYADELEKLSIGIEEIESAVRIRIEYNQLLRNIDLLVEHGMYGEAVRLIEDHSELIKNSGTDPEDIKTSVMNMKKLADLVGQIDLLIIKNETKEALKLIDKNKALLESLDISTETFKKEFFPGMKTAP